MAMNELMVTHVRISNLSVLMHHESEIPVSISVAPHSSGYSERSEKLSKGIQRWYHPSL